MKYVNVDAMMDELELPGDRPGDAWGRFLEWQTHFRLNPPLSRRIGFLLAGVIQALYNLNRNPDKNPSPFPLEDFVIYFGDDKPAAQPTAALSLEEQQARLKAHVLRMSGMSHEQFKRKYERDKDSAGARLEFAVLESLES